MQVVTLNLAYELDCVKLSIFIAAGQVNLAEASNGKAVKNLIFERILCRLVSEWIKKFGLFEFALLKTQTIVEIYVSVDRFEPHYASYHAFYLL